MGKKRQIFYFPFLVGGKVTKFTVISQKCFFLFPSKIEKVKPLEQLLWKEFLFYFFILFICALISAYDTFLTSIS